MLLLANENRYQVARDLPEAMPRLLPEIKRISLLLS